MPKRPVNSGLCFGDIAAVGLDTDTSGRDRIDVDFFDAEGRYFWWVTLAPDRQLLQRGDEHDVSD